MASILLDMHDRNCVCFMFICIVYIVCNCNSRWLLALFFLLRNVQIFPMSMSETLSYLPNMARFSLKKPNKILCRKTNYYCHSWNRDNCRLCRRALQWSDWSYLRFCSHFTHANSTWFIMFHFKFLVSLLNVILKISPLQWSEQKAKNEINPKDITQYQNMHYIFLHLVTTESSICITSWKR